VPGGTTVICYETYSATNLIRANEISLIAAGEEITFVNGLIGGIEGVTPVSALHIGQKYYITNLGDTDWYTITGLNITNFWVGQEITVVATGTGTGLAQPIFVISDTQAPNLFSISRTLGGDLVSLTNDLGTMQGQAANQRMAVWTIHVDPISSIVTLTLSDQTNPLEYVNVNRGSIFSGSQLYYPISPGPGLTRTNWQNVETVLAKQTTFDQNSMQFIDPVDMYDPTDTYDRYLVFPKNTILGGVVPSTI
jgi:hypothetical protein